MINLGCKAVVIQKVIRLLLTFQIKKNALRPWVVIRSAVISLRSLQALGIFVPNYFDTNCYFGF